MDFCLCKALKKTRHGINGANIEGASKPERIANRMPYRFGAFLDDMLPKLPNRPISDRPEFGWQTLIGRFSPVGISAGVV